MPAGAGSPVRAVDRGADSVYAWPMPKVAEPEAGQPISVPKEILDLVARFEQQFPAYKSGQYNEAHVRCEFLDPFFKALGWDVDNVHGYAEAYKDVIHEDAIRIGGAVKAPDYCFRIGGARKFFLEAKKPSVSVKDEPSAAYQLRRYAWSAKLPLSVLSDFEEFAVYDCRVKPHKDDPASAARIFYCTFREYTEQWAWIAQRFSREAVLKGSFDRFAESARGKKGTAEVDAAFLETIEGWRLELARNFALRNPKLTQRELNFAVQRTIDRIIFLRICEDRGLEDYGRLLALVNGDRIYPRLGQLFEAADARYNSGLFHFTREKGRHEPPDELTLALQLDDKLLRELLRGLYYPDSPYEFSVISADILGQVYEQFLGKVIRLTEGHRAVVDDKPEVKKAGGVYYTPTYIVDHIVQQTVGKLLEECGSRRKEAHPDGNEGDESLLTSAPTVEAIDARGAARLLDRVSKLRILDPACGSGSFLIGAYQLLLDWHLQFYVQLLAGAKALSPSGGERRGEGAHADWLVRGKNPRLVQTTAGWKLTIGERKRILLNNIFGVDIDPQAVEVTKLSLLLKVLEGETGQTLQAIFRLFHERALPDLGDNIKCGNSLIGPDFYQQAELPLLTEDERYRINVFDWQAEFPQIFRRRTSTGELRDTPASPLDYTMPGVPLHGSFTYKKTRARKAALPPVPIEPEWEGGFDAVIGNPPWGQKHILASEAEKEYVRFKYPSSVGIFDTFRPFVERGVSMARRGGAFGMVLPDIVLLKDYPQTRLFLLENLKMTAIDWWGMAFTAAVIDAATIVGFRAQATPDHRVEVAVHDPEHPLADEIPQAEFKGNPRYVFNLHLTPAKRSILQKLQSAPRLGEWFEIHEGVHSGNMRAELFVPRPVDASCRELLFGRDEIEPYHLRWDGAYLRCAAVPAGRSKTKYANLGRPGWYDQDKLLVRRTGDHVLAAVDRHRRYASNNFFIVFPLQPCALTLDGLCALLNSKVMTWYFRTIEPRAGRVFAELKIKHLAVFPLPRDICSAAAMRRLNELGAERAQVAPLRSSAAGLHEAKVHQRTANYLDDEIETEVRRLLGIYGSLPD